jgi:hypothetical protein
MARHLIVQAVNIVEDQRDDGAGALGHRREAVTQQGVVDARRVDAPFLSRSNNHRHARDELAHRLGNVAH